MTVFVTLPDNTTIEGAKIPFEFMSDQLIITSLPILTVHRPFFGSYSIGVRLENAGMPLIDFSGLAVELYSTVYANREGGSTTSLHNANIAVGFGVPSANTSQSQVAVDFTYDSALIWHTIP